MTELAGFDIRQVTQQRNRQRQAQAEASGRGSVPPSNWSGELPRASGGGYDVAFRPTDNNPNYEQQGEGGGVSSEQAGAMRLGICCLIVCGLILALVIASMAVVPPTEFGLVFNWLTQAVGDAKPNGRYFIGPFAYMIPYPAVATNIEYSTRATATTGRLSARTQDSLLIQVSTSFQLKLKEGAIRGFYLDFREDGWRGYIQREASDLLLQATSDFTRTDFWLKRSDISAAYQAKLQGFFNESMDITDVQLIQVELPVDVENTIINTQWQLQQQKTRAEEQVAITIRASINVMLSDFEREKTIIVNNATANANLLTKSAEAEAQFSRIAVENDAVDLIKEQLALTSQGIIAYQKGIAYQNLQGAKMLFGVQQTAALLNSGSTAASSDAVCGAAAAEGEQTAAHVAAAQMMLAAAPPP